MHIDSFVPSRDKTNESNVIWLVSLNRSSSRLITLRM